MHVVHGRYNCIMVVMAVSAPSVTSKKHTKLPDRRRPAPVDYCQITFTSSAEASFSCIKSSAKEVDFLFVNSSTFDLSWSSAARVLGFDTRKPFHCVFFFFFFRIFVHLLECWTISFGTLLAICAPDHFRSSRFLVWCWCLFNFFRYS